MNHLNKKTYQKIVAAIGAVILLFVIFVAGAFAGTHQSVQNILTPGKVAQTKAVAATAASTDLSEFWSIWNIMQTQYPFKANTPANQDKVYGAIAGMVSSYKDPYTEFFPPQESKLFNAQVQGSFGGVGMEVGLKGGLIVVIAPIKGTPAESAGIKSGDVIFSVDGKRTDTMDLDTVISAIRGNVGTQVVIGVLRGGSSDVKKITITRQIINNPTIDTSVHGDVFVISLYAFTQDSANLFKDALSKFAASGKTKLVIDLRNNPGGYLEDAVDIASYFLPAGKTVVTENAGNAESENIDTSKGFSLLTFKPKVAVLVNGGSASASEILSGALGQNGAATLVGTQTFGKGSVQQVIPFPDGSSLKITVAKWYTPNGTSISDKGITPDVIVPGDVTADSKTGVVTDPQLNAAIKLLDK